MIQRQAKSFIQPQRRQKKEQLTVSLDQEVSFTFKEYTQFLDSESGYVLGEILSRVFRKDKAFVKWRAEQAKPTNLLNCSTAVAAGSAI
jgi:hypothetical protein